MSDFVFQSLEGFEVGNSKKHKKSKDSKTGLIKVFVAIFSILLICELAVYFLVIPCMETVDVSFYGLKNYSNQMMMEKIASTTNKNFISFSANEAKSMLTTIPGIEDVEIVRRFPNKIYINVKEREAVAMTFVSDGERTVSVQIDKNGVLFSPNSNSVSLDKSIPLISGIPVENIPEGMRIPQKYRALMEQIAEIRGLSQNYFAAISEIHVIPKEYGNYELVLYPIHSRTRILTGRQLNEEALQYMMVALDVVNTLEPNVEEIDLRYGSVSYRTRSNAGHSYSGEYLE
ncbi:MAG: FtsQ-type POTRA domain-containing protein [Treponema sp.]|nr:FtsQ-type POTRA domain-containing protein [Candidatus Treponema equifaecale]